MDSRATRNLDLITDDSTIKDKLALILRLTDKSIDYVFSDDEINGNSPIAVFIKCSPSFNFFNIGFMLDDYIVYYYPYAAVTIYDMCVGDLVQLEMIVDFIAFHELGHCLGGHKIWQRSEQIENLEPLQSIAIEWEADEFAYKLLKQKYTDLEKLHEALTICFDYFEKHNKYEKDPYHPSRDERLWLAVHILMQNNIELKAKYDDSRVKIILANIETLKPSLQKYRVIETLRFGTDAIIHLWRN